MTDRFVAIRYPIGIDAGTGRFAVERSYDAHVRQLIFQVLFTAPGERVNRPEFGCGVRRMLFAPNSDASANLAQVSVRQALERWLNTAIRVDDVQVVAREEVLSVSVTYVVLARQERRFLNVDVAF
ncbi:MAG TPA: GPW/gp25 family protein [Candidatus Binatia bacterium]|nr:GPW/gp25 family protein [Candidatus Binatia bacterium]